MGSYRQLTGQQTPPERPDRVKPVPEHYEGVSFPYRGTENHGVDPGNVDVDEHYEFAYEDEPQQIPTLPPEEEVDPVPVKVVQDSARERMDWRAARFLVKDVPQEIVGRHEKRKSLRIRVHGDTNPIYIGPDSGLRPYTGFRIPAGTELYPFSSTENVYAVADSGTEVEISVLYEFAVEL